MEKYSEKNSNHLIHQKSPYLLQHAWNPVDWYPWSPEAFNKAIQDDKIIFLSIGYATCHWCHVMAHESFEDVEIAEILNKDFISIKVDREERPDVDNIYMSVCRAMTSSGGWPLTIIMTPDGKPFFAGTYIPKNNRMGMAGLAGILKQIVNLWETDRNRLIKAADQITLAIQPRPSPENDRSVPYIETLTKGYMQLGSTFDPEHGGFGSAPKFPTPHNLTFLLRQYKKDKNEKTFQMIEKTLDGMKNGGIFDHLGFGFHRYSVDDRWQVPHFEKMLYDQALIATAYIEAYQATGEKKYKQTAEQIFEYVSRDLTDENGGFYSAEDADSEGEEGLFYVWGKEEIIKHLGKKTGEIFCGFYGITEQGNFENNKNIPHSTVSLETFARQININAAEIENELRIARDRLFNIREKRVHPLKDDKIITSWNGLMIAALAKGYQAFGVDSYARAAEKACTFIMKNLKDEQGRLIRRYRQGEAKYPAYLDDYAFFIWGLLELYEAVFDVSYLEEAIILNREMLDIFWDGMNHGLFFTGKGNEPLIAKSKDLYDGALPSGNSVAAMNLLRLGRMTGDVLLEQKAEQIIGSFSKDIKHHPVAYTHILHAIDFLAGPALEIIVSGDGAQKTTMHLLRSIQEKYLPNKVLIFKDSSMPDQRLSALSPFIEPMHPVENKTTAYICENHTCHVPITDVEKIRDRLK